MRKPHHRLMNLGARILGVLTALLGSMCFGQHDLSRFDGWTTHVSHEAVKATLLPAGQSENGEQDGFTLNYNFTSGSGFVIVRHELKVDLPENYEVSFTLSGAGPSNDLEVKLLDSGDGSGGKLGDSVWWVKKRNFEWPESPVRVNNKSKHFQFAWGPLNGRKIKSLGALEIVVASSSGGEGWIKVTDVQYRPLPVSVPYTGTPVAFASHESEGHVASNVLDGDSQTYWSTDEGTKRTLTVDFGAVREFDAVRVQWIRPVGAFSVETSEDGVRWRRVWDVSVGRTVDSWMDVPDTTARLIRLEVDRAGEGAEGVIALSELSVHSRPAIDDNLGIWRVIAAADAENIRRLPPYFSGRQSSWTVLGVPEDSEETLISEAGVLELWRGGASLEPALTINGEVHTHADTVGGGVRMINGLPIAEVTRVFRGVTLTLTAFVDGEAGSSVLNARYVLRNTTDSHTSGVFHWLIRPFQVNPPWQFLGTQGGAARIRSLDVRGSQVLINKQHAVWFPASVRLYAMKFDEGEAGLSLPPDGTQGTSQGQEMLDPRGLGSGRADAQFELAPGGETEWVVSFPVSGGKPIVSVDGACFSRRLDACRQAWNARVTEVKFTLPPGNEQLTETVKASLAYILINRDGPGFQPGSRSYERSWIRDGALTSAALLEFGRTTEIRDFVDWYARFQFPGGGVPCVVDHRGADPVVENDSHGQFIYALAEYYRYTGDSAFLLRHFPAVEKAVSHIESERAKRKSAEFTGTATRAEPGKPAVPLRAFYGLMPESISHEGYSAKPMHSYWDDFFTLKGLRDAATIARSLQKIEQATTWDGFAADLARCIKDSITLAQEAHGISYVPGCPELGDFDATSTTIAINPCGALRDLPRAWYDATFDRWWSFFVARRDGLERYVDYTPYEWRIVGTLVMLGHRDRAWESTKWYLRDQLPPRDTGDTSAEGWLHWAEIVHVDRGAGKWIGDMPHTWVASDFLRSVRTMFVYEEPSEAGGGESLVLFAGVPAEWAEAPGGVSFEGLRTPFGTINASLTRNGDWYTLRYNGLDAARLPKRVRLAPPVAWPPNEIEVLEGGAVKNESTGGLDGITSGMSVRFR